MYYHKWLDLNPVNIVLCLLQLNFLFLIGKINIVFLCYFDLTVGCIFTTNTFNLQPSRQFTVTVSLYTLLLLGSSRSCSFFLSNWHSVFYKSSRPCTPHSHYLSCNIFFFKDYAPYILLQCILLIMKDTLTTFIIYNCTVNSVRHSINITHVV